MKANIAKYTKALLSFTLITTLVTQTLLGVSSIHAIEGEVDKNLTMNKTATYNKADNSYTISLDAYTTGDVSVVTKSKPTDIVLVLDQSGSMRDSINPTYIYPERYTKEISIALTYYYINENKSYEKLKYKRTYEEVKYPAGTKYVFHVYTKQDGSEVIALAEGGVNPSNETTEKFTAIQFYDRVENPDVPGLVKKIDALKSAANLFVNSVQKEDGDHRIAVTGFANGKNENTTGYDYLNTELYVGYNKYTYGSSEIDNQYKNAFQSMKTTDGYNNVNGSISRLATSGATNANLGLEMARKVFEKDTAADKSERNKVVIMFTDGEPTTNNDFEEPIANATIEEAKKLKDAGVTVFTVGVVDTLDNTQDPTSPNTNNLNRYMQYVSSNYPGATSLANGGVGDYTAGKFLFATDQDSLKKIFEKIKEEISSTTSTLDEKTVLRDYISDYFFVDDENKDIKVFTEDYKGMNAEGKRTWGNKTPFEKAKVVFDNEAQSISVSGFNYKENYVADKSTPIGKRVVVEIKVKAKEGFLGGNVVETNKIESGIYVNEEPIKKFDQPEVDVAINFEATAKDASMYLTQSVNAAENMFDADLNKAGMQFYYDKEKTKTADIDGINNKFVDIIYEIKLGTDTIGKATIAHGSTDIVWGKTPNTAGYTNDTKLNVVMTVKPSNSNPIGQGIEAKETAKSQDITLHVFKPTVELTNDVMFLGESYDLNKAANVTDWKANNANAPKPVGTAPTLKYDFEINGNKVSDPTAYKAKDDTTFKVFTSANGTMISNLTTFTNNGKEDQTFKLQVVKGELQITKKIDNAYSKDTRLNSNQTFIFKIEVRDLEDTNKVIATYYQSIDFDNNDAANSITEKSVTLKGLEKGQYIVTEENSWSWKYGFKASKTNYKNQINTLHIGEKTSDTTKPYFGAETGTKVNDKEITNPGTILITNGLNYTNILGDTANAINIFKGK